MQRFISLLALLFTFSVAEFLFAEEKSPLEDVAKQIVGETADILSRPDDREVVAVFPFFNQDGKITLEMGNAPAFLQGEIVYYLRDKLDPDYFVLKKGELARRFDARNVSPRRIDFNDPSGTAAALKKLGVDYAILGTFEENNKVTAKIYDVNGRVRTLVRNERLPYEARSYTISDGPTPQSQTKQQDASNVLRVEVISKGRALPLMCCKKFESDFRDALFLILPKSFLGQEYKIRLTQADKRQSQKYMLGAAVMIDGVNSLFQKNGDGDYEPVAREPQNVRRWILTPYGTQLQQAKGERQYWTGYDKQYIRINDGRLVRANGYGNSRITVSGFQRNEKSSLAFVFSDTGQSLAELLGVTDDLGLITVYVFNEAPPVTEEEKYTITKWVPGSHGERKPLHEMRIKTIPGRPMPNNIQGFNVQFQEDPTEIWRIYYRAEGDPLPGGLKRSDLVPFRQ